MAATMKGYRMTLVMPEHLSLERRAIMKAFGAELILVTKEQGMEGARDLADRMERDGKGKALNQFANPDNPRAHYEATGPEIWGDTGGRVTHFVSAMGTTGTIMGVSQFLKERIRRSRLSACNRPRARRSPASALAQGPSAQNLRCAARGP